MLIGAHISIGNGLSEAVFSGKELGCDTIQIFTKNPTQWMAKPLSEKEIDEFKKAVAETKINPIVAHDAYLINLAAPGKQVLKRSLDAFLLELQRANALKIPFLVTHMGAHLDAGEVTGLERLIESINLLIGQTKDLATKIVLETTAGQGTYLGYRFEHLATIIEGVEQKDRLAVCFDTSHAFAAGYDLRTKETYEETWHQFETIIGLDKLAVIHINDSKKPLGSRVDRHTHIGQGFLGLEAFRFLLNDKRFENIPMILETPEEALMHRVNLETLRSLAA